MNERFDELYMRRGEHQEIVAYYKRLVVSLYQKLRAQQDDSPIPVAEPEPDQALCDVQSSPLTKTPPLASNVLIVDFRQRRPLR